MAQLFSRWETKAGSHLVSGLFKDQVSRVLCGISQAGMEGR